MLFYKTGLLSVVRISTSFVNPNIVSVKNTYSVNGVNRQVQNIATHTSKSDENILEVCV